MQSSNEGNGLMIFGIIASLVIPVLGFFVGVALLAQNRASKGVAVILTSIGAFFFWALLMSS